MRTVVVNLDDLSSIKIYLGYEGEKNHTQVIINCNAFFSRYPNATATMVAQPPKGDIYPVTLTKSGKTLTWDVSEGDLAYAGSGRFQITFTQNNEVIKTAIGSYSINQSMNATGDPPEPIETWLEEAQEALEEFGAINEMTATAETIGAGSSATVTVSDVDGHKNFHFAIPRGASGNETIDDTAGLGDTDKVYSANKICTMIATVAETDAMLAEVFGGDD